MKKKFFVYVLILAACASRPPVARATLFYSPICIHCMEVINQSISPVQSQFDERLEIVWVDVTGTEGRNQYLKMLKCFNIPPERIIFPVVVIGERVLIGDEVTDEFSRVVQTVLGNGGSDWPDLNGLECSP